MERPPSTESFYLRLILKVGGALLLLVLISWGAFQVYYRWQERHLVGRAAGYLSGGDLKAASLSARRAWQVNERSARAARVLADVAERTGDNSAISWRRKVLELEPSLDDSLALVRSAMRFNDLATAEKTLQGFDEKARGRPEFHAASGRLAEIRNDLAAAEAHWAKASELAPEDTAYQRQLALLRLRSNDPATRDAARGTLERLRADPTQRAAATRALIADGASRPEDPQKVRQWASELQAYPDALFGDRLLYLEILRQLRAPEFENYLAEVQKAAVAQPADLGSLLSWLNTNGKAAEAISYVKSLPAEALKKWPVPLAHAEAYAQLKDWPGLERMAAESTWAPYDFMRRAYLARALRAQDKRMPASEAWAAAQREASSMPQTLMMLAQTVAAWDWETEAVELLWILTRSPEARAKALETLYEHYAKAGDTPGVYRVLTRAIELEPANLTMQNNLAQIALLLGANVEEARRKAAELYAREPANAAFASTHAFGQFIAGDVEGALETLERLPEERRQEPSIAAYYGIILAEAGQREKAREYLARAADARLLPEEKALVAKAESSAR